MTAANFIEHGVKKDGFAGDAVAIQIANDACAAESVRGALAVPENFEPTGTV